MSTYDYINEEKIIELMFGEEEYVIEFGKAGIDSFQQYMDQYRDNLIEGNEKSFRKEGHKIKPVARMMGLEKVVKEYERGKSLLLENQPLEDRKLSADRTEELISDIIDDLKKLINNYRSDDS